MENLKAEKSKPKLCDLMEALQKAILRQEEREKRLHKKMYDRLLNLKRELN